MGLPIKEHYVQLKDFCSGLQITRYGYVPEMAEQTKGGSQSTASAFSSPGQGYMQKNGTKNKQLPSRILIWTDLLHPITVNCVAMMVQLHAPDIATDPRSPSGVFPVLRCAISLPLVTHNERIKVPPLPQSVCLSVRVSASKKLRVYETPHLLSYALRC